MLVVYKFFASTPNWKFSLLKLFLPKKVLASIIIYFSSLKYNSYCHYVNLGMIINSLAYESFNCFLWTNHSDPLFVAALPNLLQMFVFCNHHAPFLCKRVYFIWVSIDFFLFTISSFPNFSQLFQLPVVVVNSKATWLLWPLRTFI